jgi:predicted amidohydrolase
VIVPTYELDEGQVRNSAVILDRAGHLAGRYVKVHTVPREKESYGVVAGQEYPTFDLDFARVGIMICYDAYFPEVARILALAGAEVIFFPSLQRSYGEGNIEVQVRARALDNAVHIVRSGYGVAVDRAWLPGDIAGLSCIVNDEGRIVANCGKHEGFVTARVDLDRPRRGRRSYGDDVGEMRRFLIEDRRPDTYGALLKAPAQDGRIPPRR